MFKTLIKTRINNKKKYFALSTLKIPNNPNDPTDPNNPNNNLIMLILITVSSYYLNLPKK